MTHCTDEQLIDLYYSNSASEGRLETDSSPANHLSNCSACREAYLELQVTLDAFYDLPVPEPPPFIWRKPWFARLTTVRPWMLAPILAAALAAAFLLGRATQTVNIPAPPSQLADSGRERILLVALGDHFERSQMVLLELANGDRANFPAAQERARNLIGENRLYRQTALYSGDSNYSALLDDLDRVLTTAANAQSQSSTGDVENIEQLLFKIRVTDSNLDKGSEKL